MGFLIVLIMIKTGPKAILACRMLPWIARATSSASPTSSILEIDFDAFHTPNQTLSANVNVRPTPARAWALGSEISK